MIPPQLQFKGFRFIKVRENKAPLEDNWTESNNYMFYDEEIKKFIAENKRYGVVTGFGGLVVIDFDAKFMQDELIDKLPKTFSVKTAGKGLLHLYYCTENPESFKILDLNKNTLVDIQGKGKQVIGAGSILNGKSYEVVDDLPIKNIRFSDLKNVFAKWLNLEKDIKNSNKKENDFDCKSIKEKIKVQDLLKDYNIDTSKNPTNCPLHESKGGRCLSYNDDVWHCFHCEAKGNIFHLFMAKNNCDFFEAKKALADKAGIKISNATMLKIDNYLDNARAYFQEQPYLYDKNCIWWLWRNFRWEITDEVELGRDLDRRLGFFGQTVTANIRNNNLHAMMWVGRENSAKDAPVKWIQFKDKAFSLNKKDIYAVTKDYFFTNPIPWEMGESAETPVMDRLFEEWVGKDYVKSLYEVIAYCCYREYPIQSIVCLYGSGCNGKTCFIRLVINFLGKENICSSELDSLLDSRFESFKLYKKLACFMGETNFGVLTKSSILKKLTGSDMIGFEQKNKTPFNDYSYAKLIIASNSLPTSEDTSEGFYRRWFIIDFPNQFKEGRDVLKDIPEQEYKNLAKKVTLILPELLERGSFTNQGTMESRKEKFIMASNPLSLFLKKYYERDAASYISYNELYTHYVQFLKENKKRRVKTKEFKAALEEEGYWVEKTSHKVHFDDGTVEFKSGYWVEELAKLAPKAVKEPPKVVEEQVQ